MLTNATVKAARPGARPYKISDGRGLFLVVLPSGHRSWRMKFRYQGKEQLLTLGAWPEISLGDARARCDAAREQLRRGDNPAGARRRQEPPANDAAEQTLEAIARSWHALRVPRWSPVHAADVLASLERDIFPVLGARAISSIDEAELLELLQSIEGRGRIETARRLRQRLDAIFALARRRKLIAENPAADLGEELAPRPPARNHPAIVDIDEARELLAAAELVDAGAAVKLASRFLALTAARSAAVRGATWGEIEDLDGAEPLWRIPAARMKLAAAKKQVAKFDHLVPLAPAAVEVLRAARAVRKGHDTHSPAALIFPGRGAGVPIGETAIADLYVRAGWGGRHVPHGWRAAFSTILNERFPEQRAAIDLALAHVAKDKVEIAYNRAVYLGPRRWLLEQWGEMLCPRAAGDIG